VSSFAGRTAPVPSLRFLESGLAVLFHSLRRRSGLVPVTKRRRPFTRSTRPVLEALEDRLVLSPTVQAGYEVHAVTPVGEFGSQHIDGLVVDPNLGNLYIAADNIFVPGGGGAAGGSASFFNLYRVTPTGIVTLGVTESISHFEAVNLAWGPDGYIYSADMSGTVWKINPSNGSPTFFGNVGSLTNGRYGMQFDPSGNLFIYSEGAIRALSELM